MLPASAHPAIKKVGIFFIIFVDRIFTTLFVRLFTKVFGGSGANPMIHCLYRAGNAD
jgi:hypothetical protein